MCKKHFRVRFSPSHYLQCTASCKYYHIRACRSTLSETSDTFSQLALLQIRLLFPLDFRDVTGTAPGATVEYQSSEHRLRNSLPTITFKIPLATVKMCILIVRNNLRQRCFNGEVCLALATGVTNFFLHAPFCFRRDKTDFDMAISRGTKIARRKT